MVNLGGGLYENYGTLAINVAGIGSDTLSDQADVFSSQVAPWGRDQR